MQPEKSEYDFDFSTLKPNPTSISVDILNTKNGQSFIFTLIAIQGNTFQVMIDEKIPLKPRYRTEHVLDGTPKASSLTVESHNDNEVIVTSVGNRVVLQASPLKIDFYRNDLLAVTLNDRGLMRFEHLRPKPTKLVTIIFNFLLIIINFDFWFKVLAKMKILDHGRKVFYRLKTQSHADQKQLH